MRLKGTIIDWKDDRGFGFIEPATGGGRIFCHLKAFEVRVRRPISGDKVTYEVGKDAQGRLNAAKIRPVGLEHARYQSNITSRQSAAASRKISAAEFRPTSPSTAFTYISISIFLAAVIVLALAQRIPIFVPLVYVVMSGITIFAYALDKSAAMNRRWRTKEQSLHLLELLGGWPGAWIAQKLLRHKSRKASFRIEFWLCAGINIAVLAWCASKADWH